MGICLRGEGGVSPVETFRAAVTAGEQKTRKQGRQRQRKRAIGARTARHTHLAGRWGLRLLRGGVVAAGLRHGRAPRAGEGDDAANRAPHRAAEPADEARTNPLVGLGSTAGCVERGWHGSGK